MSRDNRVESKSYVSTFYFGTQTGGGRGREVLSSWREKKSRTTSL